MTRVVEGISVMSKGESEVPKCVACGGVGHPHLMLGSHRLYRCEECGNSFCHPVPSDEALADYYRSYHLSAEEGGLYDVVDARMQADFPAKLVMIQKLGPVGRLLDVGCGKGFFVDYCCRRGIDAAGIDLSASAIEYAKLNLEGRYYCGVLEHAGERAEDLGGLFDTITMWATIEHVSDPESLLRAAVSRLKVGGMVHLDTGIGNDWMDRWLPGNVQWYDPPQHLFVFSERGLKRLCERVGFRVVRYTGCFERTGIRWWMRVVRNGVATVLLAGLGGGLGLSRSMKGTTRFPMGNLQSISLQRMQ
jgi:SAM-dependent methyltransferase